MDVYKSEKEQWEDVKAWLRENAVWIAAGIAIGVGVIYGWRFWQSRESHRALEAKVHYGNVLNALYANKKDEALKEIATLDADYHRTPYADQSRLALARYYVDAGKFQDAIAPLTTVMNDSSDEALRLVARLRVARLQAATQKPDEALRTLEGAGASGFDPRVQEVRGDILLAKGDRAGALRAYQAAATSKVPQIVNEDLLKLKIADLADLQPAAQATPVEKDKTP